MTGRARRVSPVPARGDRPPGFVVFHRLCRHVINVTATRVLADRIAAGDHAWRVRSGASKSDVGDVLARVRCEVCQPPPVADGPVEDAGGQ